MSNILFLLEGAYTERKYYKVIEKAFSDKIKSNVNFYSYATNIHVLYRALKEDPDLDIIGLVKEKAKSENDIAKYKMLTENKFGEVYLIFDLDPHDTSFDANKIQELLDLFDNETEYGKLYINYPMVESFKHFKSIPDADFNSYKVPLEKCGTYKKDVSKISCINHISEIDKSKYFNIMKQNVAKINWLINKSCSCDYNTYLNDLTQNNIFNIERKTLEKSGEVYVINTMCLWPLDYFDKQVFSDVMNNAI